jgi:hypothetical protein
MPSPPKRREVLAFGAAGLSALAGCQSAPLSGSGTPIRIAISSLLDRPQEIWVQLTRNDDSDPVGDSFVLDPNASTVLEREVPVDTYQFTASVDDLSQGPKRQVRWEITNESCSATGIVTVAGGDDGPEMVVDTASCDDQ